MFMDGVSTLSLPVVVLKEKKREIYKKMFNFGAVTVTVFYYSVPRQV